MVALKQSGTLTHRAGQWQQWQRRWQGGAQGRSPRSTSDSGIFAFTGLTVRLPGSARNERASLFHHLGLGRRALSLRIRGRLFESYRSAMCRSVQNRTCGLVRTPHMHRMAVWAQRLLSVHVSGHPLAHIAVSIAASASFIVSSASVSDMTARANTYTTGVERAESKAFLAAHASCADCGEAATVVDHNTRHTEGDATIFWDKSRRVARCKRDHDRKSATRDGGFGRGRRQETPRPSTQDDATSWGWRPRR